MNRFLVSQLFGQASVTGQGKFVCYQSDAVEEGEHAGAQGSIGSKDSHERTLDAGAIALRVVMYDEMTRKVPIVLEQSCALSANDRNRRVIPG